MKEEKAENANDKILTAAAKDKEKLMKQGNLKVNLNNQLFCKSWAKGLKDEHCKNKSYKNDAQLSALL